MSLGASKDRGLAMFVLIAACVMQLNGASVIAAFEDSPSAPTPNVQHYVFVDSNQHLHQISWNYRVWASRDLTAASGAPAVATGSAIAAFEDYPGAPSPNAQHYVFVDSHQHLRQIWWNYRKWTIGDLTVATSAPVVREGSAIAASEDSGRAAVPYAQHFLFVDGNRHLRQICWNPGTSTWTGEDLTTAARSPGVGAGSEISVFADSPSALTPKAQHYLFVDSYQHLRQICWNPANSTWGGGDLTAAAGAPSVGAGSAISAFEDAPSAMVPNAQHFAFADGNQNLRQMWLNPGTNAWTVGNITSDVSGAPLVAGSAVATFEDSPSAPTPNVQHFLFVDRKKHFRQIAWNPSSGTWGRAGDLTAASGAPAVALTATISGQVTAGGLAISGVSLTLSGSSSGSVSTDANGHYSFAVLESGTYTVTPSWAGFSFTPSSAGPFTNLGRNLSQGFTALPSIGYTTGTGFSSIPNSFTGPAPVMSCTDFSGSWNDTDGQGNSSGWQLSQSGSSISGVMSYRSYRSGQSCGTITYSVTGTVTGGVASLTAKLVGSPYDSCGYPVASSRTEAVSLSGRACGVGAATFKTFTGSNPSSADAGKQNPTIVSPPLRTVKPFLPEHKAARSKKSNDRVLTPLP